MGWLRRFVEEDAGDGEPGVAVHLTMYGEPFRQAIPRIRRDRPLVVIVGGAKVPGDVYKYSQYNIAGPVISLIQKLQPSLSFWMPGTENLERTLLRRCEINHPADGQRQASS